MQFYHFVLKGGFSVCNFGKIYYASNPGENVIFRNMKMFWSVDKNVMFIPKIDTYARFNHPPLTTTKLRY